MHYNSTYVIALANSIIGVSIIAMPYCFKQCGIILSIMMILVSSIISRLACHYLLKSAILSRRKTFEFLAFHIFGSMGKFLIEIGIIGLLLGTCVAFFVVMGDLGPELIAQLSGATINSTLRSMVLITIALFFILPITLLKNIDSLDFVSKATIAFYVSLAVKVILEAFPCIVAGEWLHHVNLWRTDGIMQCLPIFSMALFCQAQLFEIYQTIPNVSLEAMNDLIRMAVNICTSVYILVGTFGYIAFYDHTFSGNILLSFHPSFMSSLMRLGFVLSIAFSFPLVVFPCRTSIHSLLYKEITYTLHEGSTEYIPETKFKCITVAILIISLTIAHMIPNIELVLGLIGSTIGIFICVLFPVTCFICISQRNTNERILAQIMFSVGVIVMVLGTYANLYVSDIPSGNSLAPSIKKDVDQAIRSESKPLVVATNHELLITPVINAVPVMNVAIQHTQIPKQPQQQKQQYEAAAVPTSARVRASTSKQMPKIVPKSTDKTSVEHAPNKPPPAPPIPATPNKEHEQVDAEAIKKEDKELKEQEKETNEMLIETIQKQQEMQKVMAEQNKKLIEVIEKQQAVIKDTKVNEVKVEAVKQIESMAKKAIEKISGNELNSVADAKASIPQIKQNKLTESVIVNRTHKQQSKPVHDKVGGVVKSNIPPIVLALNKSEVVTKAPVVEAKAKVIRPVEDNL